RAAWTHVSASAWTNVRASGVAPPSGKVFPTHPPVGTKPIVYIPQSEWTEGMRQVARLATRLSVLLRSHDVTVSICDDLGSIRADYHSGRRVMRFSLRTLGASFFDAWQSKEGLACVVSLILHELAHDVEHNHLKEDFYRAIQGFSGVVAAKALFDPAFFAPHTDNLLPSVDDIDEAEVVS
ncbi:MAG: hypothetical protein ACYDGM_14640, partial [Vulcanimicrobiaceae bacterium]